MNNYEYIISCLPVLDAGPVSDVGAVVDSIRSQCSKADNVLIDTLLDSFNPDRLNADFYKNALESPNGFLREYLLWDLRVRNTKAEYLNRSLGRPEEQDVVDLPGGSDYDEKPSVCEILEQSDILQREKGLDSLMWDKAQELISLHLFDMDVILSFIARLMIADRWNKLDPKTGRELFHTLVNEIRKTR